MCKAVTVLTDGWARERAHLLDKEENFPMGGEMFCVTFPLMDSDNHHYFYCLVGHCITTLLDDINNFIKEEIEKNPSLSYR